MYTRFYAGMPRKSSPICEDIFMKQHVAAALLASCLRMFVGTSF